MLTGPGKERGTEDVGKSNHDQERQLGFFSSLLQPSCIKQGKGGSGFPEGGHDRKIEQIMEPPRG